MKESRIDIRIEPGVKLKWQQFADSMGIKVSELIVIAVNKFIKERYANKSGEGSEKNS